MVPGEASGRGRTAIPYRRLSLCSTRAWTCSMGDILPSSTKTIMAEEAYDLAPSSHTTQGPHPLFHRRCVGGQGHGARPPAPQAPPPYLFNSFFNALRKRQSVPWAISFWG